MNTSVKIGPATIVGYVGAAVFAGLAAWAEAEGTGQSKWLAIIAGGLAALTNFNRSIQAPKGDAAVADTELPPALQQLAQSNVAAVQASPDGVDGPHVPAATE